MAENRKRCGADVVSCKELISFNLSSPIFDTYNIYNKIVDITIRNKYVYTKQYIMATELTAPRAKKLWRDRALGDHSGMAQSCIRHCRLAYATVLS